MTAEYNKRRGEDQNQKELILLLLNLEQLLEYLGPKFCI
jgi:hypothetical protein